MKEKRYAEAMTYAEQALKYIMASGFQENSALSRVALSDIYSIMGLVNYETGSYGLAREYLLRGYHLLDSLEDYSRIRGIAEPLAMIYQKAGRADSALLIYQRILIKSDTFTNNQITSFSKLFTAQMEYEQEVREQQLQLQYRKTIQKRNLMIFIGSGILLILVVLLLVLRLRLEQQKKRRVEAEKKQALLERQQAVLEKEKADVKLESQTREMTMNVMNLIRKNELMLEFSKRLVLIGKNTEDRRTGSEIMQLITTMEQNASTNVWEEFELRFSQVHNSYYERLLSRFPELSPGDLKLCALLKLNLSTKEICELSGQRPSTLDMARYRLRKKLGLTPQDNLVTFLSQV
jgi:tetratricopeptide (TPR) repeat protein